MCAARRPDGSFDPAADFHDDGGTPNFRARRRQRNREGWAAIGWALARVILFFPLLATITVPVGALAYAIAATFAGYDSAIAILFGISIGVWLAESMIRDAGGMAFFGRPIYMRTPRQPQSFLEAAMFGTRDGLMSIYRAYVVMFYAVVAVVIWAAAAGYFNGPTGPS